MGGLKIQKRVPTWQSRRRTPFDVCLTSLDFTNGGNKIRGPNPTRNQNERLNRC